MKEYTKEVNISKFITWQSLADYIYIIDERSNRLFFLDGIGKDIWLFISNNMKILDMTKKLSEIYNYSSIDQISKIVIDFLKRLIEMEFVYE